MNARALLVGSLLLVGACHAKESANEEAAPADELQLRELETPKPGDNYEPSASDVPLTADFAKAAAKRVTPDNYRKELTLIERELDQLASSTESEREAQPGEPEEP